MKTLTLVLEISDEDMEVVLPTLRGAIDADSLVGVRLKDVDTMAENQLAQQVYVNVLTMGVD